MSLGICICYRKKFKKIFPIVKNGKKGKKCSQSSLFLKCFPDTAQTQNTRFQTITAIVGFS